MANFKDVFKKYIVYGECYYNLENHELKLNSSGHEIEEYTEMYPTPKDEVGFINVLSQYINKCEEALYDKGEKLWIKLQDNDYTIKLMLIDDSNK